MFKLSDTGLLLLIIGTFLNVFSVIKLKNNFPLKLDYVFLKVVHLDLHLKILVIQEEDTLVLR